MEGDEAQADYDYKPPLIAKARCEQTWHQVNLSSVTKYKRLQYLVADCVTLFGFRIFSYLRLLVKYLWLGLPYFYLFSGLFRALLDHCYSSPYKMNH